MLWNAHTRLLLNVQYFFSFIYVKLILMSINCFVIHPNLACIQVDLDVKPFTMLGGGTGESSSIADKRKECNNWHWNFLQYVYSNQATWKYAVKMLIRSKNGQFFYKIMNQQCWRIHTIVLQQNFLSNKVTCWPYEKTFFYYHLLVSLLHFEQFLFFECFDNVGLFIHPLFSINDLIVVWRICPRCLDSWETVQKTVSEKWKGSSYFPRPPQFSHHFFYSLFFALHCAPHSELFVIVLDVFGQPMNMI